MRYVAMVEHYETGDLVPVGTFTDRKEADKLVIDMLTERLTNEGFNMTEKSTDVTFYDDGNIEVYYVDDDNNTPDNGSARGQVKAVEDL